jgi:hypothetical protein
LGKKNKLKNNLAQKASELSRERLGIPSTIFVEEIEKDFNQ